MKYVLLFLMSVSANAADKPMVVLFGGYASSNQQMLCWAGGAKTNSSYSGYDFKGVAYPPGAGASRDAAVSAGRSRINMLVNDINAHPGRKYIIAGHSSGAALANEAARLVRDPSQIELVDLDGFRASNAIQRRVRTTCVYAVNQSGLPSRNAPSMESCARPKMYRDHHCKTKWCLHFSVVNTVAPANLSSSTFKRDGYKGCGTNLSWLRPLRAARPISYSSQQYDEETDSSR
jgi:hypothetical protein